MAIKMLPRTRLSNLIKPHPTLLRYSLFEIGSIRPISSNSNSRSNRKPTGGVPFEKPDTNTCRGCGSVIHSNSPAFPGYIPQPTQSQPKSFSQPKTSKRIPKNLIPDLFNNLDDSLKKQMLEYSNPETVGLEADFQRAHQNKLLLNQIKKAAPKDLICHRCYNLQHHKNVSSDWSTNSKVDFSYLNFLREQPNSTIVFVVDSFDLGGSLLKGFKESIIGSHSSRKIVVVFNKRDLLPKEMTHSATARVFREQLAEAGLLDNILKTFLVSAKSEDGVKELVEYLDDVAKGHSDIFLVGCTNVGKSELVNAIVKLGTKHERNQRKFNLTTSIVPGTTMGMIKIPLQGLNNFSQQTPFDKKSFGIFDTPGIFNTKQLLHYLTHQELKLVLPTKSFVAKTYRWHPGKSIFFGGLVRLDYTKGVKSILVTVYTNLPIHMTNLITAGELMDQLNANQPTFLYPPIHQANVSRITSLPLPPFRLTANSPLTITPPSVPGRTSCDLTIAGLGWVSIILSNRETDPIELQAYSRGGHGITTRKPFVPVRPQLLIQPYVKPFAPPHLD